MDDKVTATQVRRDFTYARNLMRLFDAEMRGDNDPDELGVLAHELVAIMTTAFEYALQHGASE